MHLWDRGIERRDLDVQGTGQFWGTGRQDLQEKGSAALDEQRQAAGTEN